MVSISEHMASDHKRCDDLFLAAEKTATEGSWGDTRQAYQKFQRAMTHHFAREEKALFLDFEQAQGSEMGPTQVMRYEHEQMRELMKSMQDALGAEDKDEFLGQAETLLVFMQQHNAKEETMLYPMVDQVLASQSDQVLSRIQAVQEE